MAKKKTPMIKQESLEDILRADCPKLLDFTVEQIKKKGFASLKEFQTLTSLNSIAEQERIQKNFVSFMHIKSRKKKQHECKHARIDATEIPGPEFKVNQNKF